MVFVAVAFVGIGAVGMLRALVYEPLLDLNCGPFCAHSPVLLTANVGFAAVLEAASTTTTILLCGSVGLAILIRLLRLPTAGLRTTAEALLVICAMAALTSAAIVGLARTAAPSPSDLARVFALQAGACMALAIAALSVAFDRLIVRRNLAQVARLLGARDGPLTVQAILSHAVGAPDLRVGYWTDDIGYVGADGLPLEETGVGQHRTELISRSRPVAVLIYDNQSLPSDLLVEQFGPRARLAIQNESLQLQLRRQVGECVHRADGSSKSARRNDAASSEISTMARNSSCSRFRSSFGAAKRRLRSPGT